MAFEFKKKKTEHKFKENFKKHQDLRTNKMEEILKKDSGQSIS